MKAYVLNDVGQLDYMEIPVPSIGIGQALVEIKAAGICGSDIPRIFDTGTYHFPTVPGHEFAGIVREVGSVEDEKLIGKRVGIFPLIPCMECEPCKNKTYEMCKNYNYLGSRCDGGFAEYVAVPVRNIIEIPDCVSFEAAAMLEPASVGIHGLKKVNMGKVSSVAIFGPGTIGLLMAQWLRCLGVGRIILIGTNEGQRQMASKLGFDEFYNGKARDIKDIEKEIVEMRGVDLSIECVGDGKVLDSCLEITKRGGEILVVGNPHGDVELPKQSYWKILRKQLKIVGTWNSSFIPEAEADDWRLTIEAFAKNKIIPEVQITHKLRFNMLKDGLDIMKNKKEYYNKIMIVR